MSCIKNFYHGIPRSYEILGGFGCFAKVLRCLDKDSGQTVAIKLYKGYPSEDEAALLQWLMDNNLDQKNIVKFHGLVNRSLVFEFLDLALIDYIYDRRAPLKLRYIRTIIQQVATALDALKTLGVIHADVTAANIMLDCQKVPNQVKLISFGRAFSSQKADDSVFRKQPLSIKAPEVILGLPYAEAVDVWALGCLLSFMTFRCVLFPAKDNYEVVRYISDLLGPPPDHIISKAPDSECYFKKNDSGQWTTMTLWLDMERRRYAFRSLDMMKQVRLERDNKNESHERTECINLLKATLTWDQSERITPRGVLHHPFITQLPLQQLLPQHRPKTVIEAMCKLF